MSQATPSESLTTEQTAKTAKLIDDVLEPKIRKMVEETNKILAKQGIHIGCEVQWFMDKKED